MKKVKEPVITEASWRAELEAIADSGQGRAVRFTAEHDAAILAREELGINMSTFAKWFAKRYKFGSWMTLKRREEYLTETVH